MAHVSRRISEKIVLESPGGRLIYPGLILSFLLLSVITQFSIYINHDVGIILYFSKRLMQGGSLYVDIMDPNPPLIFYIYLIPNYIAQLLNVSPIPLFRLMIFFFIFLSLYLSNIILKNDLHNRSLLKKALFLSLVFVFTILVDGEFGQREHIMLLLATPYLLLTATRLDSRAEGKYFQIMVGILAGIGFSIKPFFLLVPVVLESFLWWRTRNLISRNNLSLIAMILVILLYLLSIIFFTSYFQTMVPLVLQVYAAFGKKFYFVMLFSLFNLIIASVLYYIFLPKEKYKKNYYTVIFLSLVSFALIYFIQKKGWKYQKYPFEACYFLFLITICTEWFEDTSKYKIYSHKFIKFCYALIISLILSFFFFFVIWHGKVLIKGNRNQFIQHFITVSNKYATKSSMFIFTSYVEYAFPMINYTNVEWASRFPSLWLLPGIINQQSLAKENIRLRDNVQHIKQYLFDSVVEDLQKYQPALVIIDDTPVLDGNKFDYVKFFSQDTRFLILWSKYQQVAKTNYFRFFALKPDIPKNNNGFVNESCNDISSTSKN